MTVAELVADLVARGVTLEPRGEKLAVRPVSWVTPPEIAALRAHKGEVLALLRSPASPAPLHPGAPGFETAVARLLGLPLNAFATAGQCLEVRVAWYPETLWFVSGDRAAEALVTEGVSRGRVWTAAELADLLSVSGITRDQARSVALAKLGFDGAVTEFRSRPHSEACDCLVCVPLSTQFDFSSQESSTPEPPV